MFSNRASNSERFRSTCRVIDLHGIDSTLKMDVSIVCRTRGRQKTRRRAQPGAEECSLQNAKDPRPVRNALQLHGEQEPR